MNEIERMRNELQHYMDTIKHIADENDEKIREISDLTWNYFNALWDSDPVVYPVIDEIYFKPLILSEWMNELTSSIGNNLVLEPGCLWRCIMSQHVTDYPGWDNIPYKKHIGLFYLDDSGLNIPPAWKRETFLGV